MLPIKFKGTCFPCLIVDMKDFENTEKKTEHKIELLEMTARIWSACSFPFIQRCLLLYIYIRLACIATDGHLDINDIDASLRYNLAPTNYIIYLGKWFPLQYIGSPWLDLPDIWQWRAASDLLCNLSIR